MIDAAQHVPARLDDRPTDVWSYISPSRLNLWLRCPLAFKLRYIDGVVTPTSTAAFVGKMVHLGLERFYRHRQLGLLLDADMVVAKALAAWEPAVAEEQVRFASTADEQTARQQVESLLRCYLAKVPIDEPRPLAVEAVLEQPLVNPVSGEDLGLPLLGIVDLVLDGETGPTIIDFKTSSRTAPPHEITHEVQLTSYAWLFRQSTGQQESGLEIRSLVKTKTPQVQTHRYPARREQHFGRLFALVRAYLDDLDSRRFLYRPGHACVLCEHRNTHCARWAG